MRRGLGLLLPLVLLAQGAQDSAELRQKLAALQGRLGQVDQQLASLKKRRKGVLVEIQGISLQRDRAKAQVEGARLRRDQASPETAPGDNSGLVCRGRVKRSEMLDHVR